MTKSILPAGIRIHKTGKFIVDITIKGERITKTFASLEEAVLWRAKAKANGIPSDCAKGKELEKVSWTLKEAFNAVYRTRWASLPSAQTNQFNALAAFRFFGESTKLRDITSSRVAEYLDHLKAKGDTASTVNKKLSVLSVLFKVAEERDCLGGDDIRIPKMPRMKRTDHRIRFLSSEEETKLLDDLRLHGYSNQADAVSVLIYTGFRCSELWKMEVRDVDPVHGTVTVWETKNGHSRSVPMLACIKPILLEHCKSKGMADKVFEMGSNEWLRNAWEVAREDLGFASDPQFVPHMLRHTCATRLSQQGVSLPVIKQWLGHSTIQTTIRYAHFNQHDLFAASDLLNQTSNH